MVLGVLLASLLAPLATSCGKSSKSTEPAGGQAPETATPQPPPSTAATAAPSEAALQEQLRALTQAVRRYSVEKQRVPASLEEVVAAGYIRNMPPAPPGKKYMLNRSTVVLVNQ